MLLSVLLEICVATQILNVFHGLSLPSQFILYYYYYYYYIIIIIIIIIEYIATDNSHFWHLKLHHQCGLRNL
jgi:hypothetical protein